MNLNDGSKQASQPGGPQPSMEPPSMDKNISDGPAPDNQISQESYNFLAEFAGVP